MPSRTLASRLLSPAGFGLVLIFFLLPFVAISCDTQRGPITATFTGIDMVVGGSPTIGGPDISADDQQGLRAVLAPLEDQIAVEPLAIVAAVVILLAMAAVLIRERLSRHAIGSGLAAVAIALIVSAELHSIDRLQALRASAIGGTLDAPPTGATTPQYGFWLTTVALAGLTIGHAAGLVLAWRQSRPRAPTPALTHPPGDGASSELAQPAGGVD